MRKPRPLPSRDQLINLLDYDLESGALLWKRRQEITWKDKQFNTKHAGKPAGCLNLGRPDGSNRYMVVGFRLPQYQQFKAHRIIWKMMTGDDPQFMIDHKDNDPLNLKWSNLRLASNGENLRNAKLRRDNTSGVKGVSWFAKQNQWKAYISVDGRFYQLGFFNTLTEAASVVSARRDQLHGDFARHT